MAKRKSAKAKKAKKAKQADPSFRAAHAAIRRAYKRVKAKGGTGSRLKLKKLKYAFNTLGNIEI